MHSHPENYRAAQFTRKGGDLEVKDVKWREPERNEVVVQVLACGASMYDYITKEDPMNCIKYPMAPGHEIVGKVCCVGQDVGNRFKQGDIVASAWHGGHDFVCESCRTGDFVCCEKEEVNGLTRQGGYAQYCYLRAEACSLVPHDMRLDWPSMTAILGAGTTIFNSLKELDMTPGETIAIHAAGVRAKLACTMAHLMGFRVCMIGQDRRFVLPDDAIKNGPGSMADVSFVQIGPETGKDLMKHHRGAMAILCLVPDTKHLASFVDGLKPNGHLVIFTPSMHHDKMELPMIPLIARRRSVTGWPASSPAQTEQCFQFVKMHSEHFKRALKIKAFELRDAQKAFEMAMQADQEEKPVICMS